MAPTQKANYKTYEAQARMVRALVAAHPEVKWNYKEIQKFYGSDMTQHALNHRFRPLRRSVAALKMAAQRNMDCKNVPVDLTEEDDIAKFFGESTADGIQFQFRGIKKDAEKLREAVIKGESPATALNLGSASASSTPRGFSTPRSKATPAKSRPSGASTGGRSVKRTKALDLSGEEDEEDIDCDELETPTKDRNRDRVMAGRITKSRPPNTGSAPLFVGGTANNRAAPSATTVLMSTSVDLTGSESEVNTPENAASGEGEDRKPVAELTHVNPSTLFNNPAAFSQAGGADQWIGGVADDDAAYNHSFAAYSSYNSGSYMDAEGEI